MPSYNDIAAVNAITSRGQAAAQSQYYQSLASGKSRDQALAEAQFAWQKELDTAAQTGMWQGQWNMPSKEWFTSQFGTWMPEGPQAGQETMALQNQKFGQGQSMSELFGQYYAPGTAPTQGAQTLEAQNIANQLGLNQGTLTGWYTDPQGNRVQTLAGQGQQFNQGLQTQQEQRAAQAQGQTQAQAYLQLLAGLRGPADWAKYQQVLGSTPGGMRDLVAAAMGQYVPGGGAVTGVQPQAVSLQSLMGDVSGNPYSGQGGGQLNMPSVYQYNQGVYGGQPQAQQPQTLAAYQQAGQAAYQGAQGQPYAQAQQYQQALQPQQQGWSGETTGASGSINAQGQFVQDPAAAQRQTWGSGIGVGAQQPTPQQQQQGLGGGTNMPAPNQVAAQSWNNLAPTQKQMMLGMWEGQGWDKSDVEGLMSQALPKYASNASSAGTWRLR
jgi:hypothetical protein